MFETSFLILWKCLYTHLLYWLKKAHFYWTKCQYQSCTHIAETSCNYCWKMPVNQRHYWRKKQLYWKKVQVTYLAKHFIHIWLKLKAQRINFWKFLFRKGPLPYQIDRKVEGDTFTLENQEIETKTKTFDFKIARMQAPECSIMEVQHQMVNISFTT